MTPLRLALKTSAGAEVQLRAGREAGWPDGARMHWVRVVDGVPEVVTATLALEWGTGLRSPCCNIDLDASTPWDGFVEARDVLSDDDATRLDEWAHTFQSEVDTALADTKALQVYADLHWLENASMNAFATLPAQARAGQSLGQFGSVSVGERCLAQWVRAGLLEAAEKRSRRRAEVEFEAEGGRLETEDRPGSERGNVRSVPVEVFEQAAREMGRCPACGGGNRTHSLSCRLGSPRHGEVPLGHGRGPAEPAPCWCTNCTALFVGIPHRAHEGCAKGGMARLRTYSTIMDGATKE